jgi:hypothetical protein
MIVASLGHELPAEIEVRQKDRIWSSIMSGTATSSTENVDNKYARVCTY